VNPELERKVAKQFTERFGSVPEGIAFAPGRVNLIGEHVDYNDGLVLPMPLSEGTAIAWSRNGSDTFAAIAADFAEQDLFGLHPVHPETESWRSYVRGMVAESGLAREGLNLAIAGDLPRGSGLSSSASLCIAVGRTLAAAAQLEVGPVALSKAAQATEHHWAGVICGIMDQMAVAAGEQGTALLLDCRDLSYQTVSLPTDWTVAIVDSGITRGLVDGEYNARRAQCESAASKLGLASLRDASCATVANGNLEPVERRRAQHVVAEIERVREGAAAIAARDIAALAAILRAGHASLRDLFEVSVPPVDTLVDSINAALGDRGGARMTGGGFGGALVVVLEREAVPQLRAALDRPFHLVL
jgi:galactokinase